MLEYETSLICFSLATARCEVRNIYNVYIILDKLKKSHRTITHLFVYTILSY